MKYRFWGWEHADAKAITAEYKGIETPVDLYDALSHVWCADTCAPRMRQNWAKENMFHWMTRWQISIWTI